MARTLEQLQKQYNDPAKAGRGHGPRGRGPMGAGPKPAGASLKKNKGAILRLPAPHGSTMLLVIDYSAHDQAKRNTVSEKTVMLTGIDMHGAAAVDGRSLRRLIGDNGRLDGIAVTLHPHESALIRLF